MQQATPAEYEAPAAGKMETLARQLAAAEWASLLQHHVVNTTNVASSLDDLRARHSPNGDLGKAALSMIRAAEQLPFHEDVRLQYGQCLADHVLYIKDVTASVTINSESTFRYCSFCCETGVKMAKSHVVPNSVLKQHVKAVGPVVFKIESKRESMTNPDHFTRNHHCVPCDNHHGRIIEDKFTHSELFARLSGGAFVAALTSPMPSLRLDGSLRPFLLLIAFRTGFLRIHKDRDEERPAEVISDEWRLLDAIRRELQHISAVGSHAQPSQRLHVYLFPVPVAQLCAYTEANIAHAVPLINTFTSYPAYIVHKKDIPVPIYVVCVALPPYLVAVSESPVAEYKTFEMQTHGHIPYAPTYASDLRVNEVLLEKQAEAIVGLVQCFSYMVWSTFRDKTARLFAPEFAPDVEDGKEVSTMLPLRAPTNNVGSTVQADLDIDYYLQLQREVLALHRTALNLPLLPPLDIPTGGMDYLSRLFNPAAASHLDRLWHKAMRGDVEAQIMLGATLFSAFNLHRPWQSGLGLFALNRTSLHQQAGREAMLWLVIAAPNSAKARFMIGRMYHCGYDEDLSDRMRALIQLKIHSSQLRFLPSMVERIRVMLTLEHDFGNCDTEQISLVVELFNLEWRRQGEPTIVHDCNVFAGSVGHKIRERSQIRAPKVTAPFAYDCSMCKRDDVKQNSVVICGVCERSFYCSEKCRGEHRLRHSRVCFKTTTNGICTGI